MANIKPIDQSSDKWSRRAAVAGVDYQFGVQNPRRPWADAAISAGANYRAGVTAAANAGRFEAGIKTAGEEKWKNRSVKVGPGRFAEGVAVAKPDWESGFKPYQEAINSINLPARGPKGSPANLQRVQAVSTALRSLFERKASGK